MDRWFSERERVGENGFGAEYKKGIQAGGMGRHDG